MMMRIGVFFVLIAGGLVLFVGGETRQPVVSVEARFTEVANTGLHIIPASCPSAPHYGGECSGDEEGWWTIINDPQLPVPIVSDACPIGYSLFFGQCLFFGCPSGYRLMGGLCVLSDITAQCVPTYFCVGNDLHYRNGQCVESGPIQRCAFGCSGSGCVLPLQGTGEITAQPTLIKSGERTTVSWETENMTPDSCTVSENNPDIQDSGSGETNSFVSGEIRQQTVYTLTCEQLAGGIFTDSVTVNVIPVFQEN